MYELLQPGLRAGRAHLAAVPQLLDVARSGRPGRQHLALPAAGHAGDHGCPALHLALLIPSILLAFWTGNKFGAFAARKKWLDGAVLPVGYILTATPYMWLAILLAWLLGTVFHVFPIAGAYGFNLSPALSLRFAESLAWHWFLPFLSLFLVGFGGWAIGMRNLIIYELDADYSRYLQSLGRAVEAGPQVRLPQRAAAAAHRPGALARRHRRRRARDRGRLLVSGPRAGTRTRPSVNQDYFLLQGIFLFVIIGVLVANFLIDIVYVIVDPRVRLGMESS